MEFLKKHYEKMVLCLVLLGLAGAVLWMKSAVEDAKQKAGGPVSLGAPPRTAPPAPLDLSLGLQALAQVTNPPAVVLSGDHNLFNPVTWKRKTNSELLKVVRIGADALSVTNITPYYTIITYERSEGSFYVMGIQKEVDLNQPKSRVKHVSAHKDEKNKTWPFIVRGIKGAEDNPSEINLEMVDTGDTNVWVSTNNPFRQVESYTADLKYDPDPSLPLQKKKVKDEIRLDNDPYIIVEITNDAVRVQSRRTTKVTELKWTKSP
jgi:hypothetical protein